APWRCAAARRRSASPRSSASTRSASYPGAWADAIRRLPAQLSSEDMGKVWVLDTETKGTGANMVPLEKVLERPDARREREPIFVPPKRGERPVEAPAPKPPPRFKVVDVLTRQALAEDADGRATVDVLKGVRSVV